MEAIINRETIENKYEAYRSDLIQAINLIAPEPGVYATKLNNDAIKIAMSWPNYWKPSSWDKELNIYRRTKPKRIELAFWKDEELLGVTLGHPTRRGTGLRMNLVQAAPKNKRDGLKMMPIILAAYDLYAGMLSCDHVRVVKPLNKDLVRLYINNGFSELRRNSEHEFQTRKVSK